MAQYVPRFAGSGIVYALTVRWTERIAQWLQSRGIEASSYSAELSGQDRLAREGQLLRNEIKVLVATTALGMGFDKPDLGFVVHFHQPQSVVHYYQQVGRAGRSLAKAYGVMLSGGEDQAINDYFIENAFPPEEHVAAILNGLERSDHGLTLQELEATVNLAHSHIERVLKTLAVETPAPLACIEKRWVTTPQRYDPERRRRLVAHVTQIRRMEQAQMQQYQQHTGCLMEFLARTLDDPEARPCGICAPCQGQPESLRAVSDGLAREAGEFLRQADLQIEPRARVPPGSLPGFGWSGSLTAERRAEQGRALCLLSDSVWGSLVRRGKYQDSGFSDELVVALADLVGRWQPSPAPTWVTCVPSLDHPNLVPDMARRLANRFSLPFWPVIRKVRPTRPQKEMENSWQQAHNLDRAFEVVPWKGIAGPVMVVDDIVDSGWTFTILAALLRQAGSGPVFPLALAGNR